MKTLILITSLLFMTSLQLYAQKAEETKKEKLEEKVVEKKETKKTEAESLKEEECCGSTVGNGSPAQAPSN